MARSRTKAVPLPLRNGHAAEVLEEALGLAEPIRKRWHEADWEIAAEAYWVTFAKTGSHRKAAIAAGKADGIEPHLYRDFSKGNIPPRFKAAVTQRIESMRFDRHEDQQLIASLRDRVATLEGLLSGKKAPEKIIRDFLVSSPGEDIYALIDQSKMDEIRAVETLPERFAALGREVDRRLCALERAVDAAHASAAPLATPQRTVTKSQFRKLNIVVVGPKGDQRTRVERMLTDRCERITVKVVDVADHKVSIPTADLFFCWEERVNTAIIRQVKSRAEQAGPNLYRKHNGGTSTLIDFVLNEVAQIPPVLEKVPAV